ncbi:flagellar biosynthesis protein FlhA [Paraphotobacterium marinum]|uniref:flagellar biosynthesis protein FlhA n=1 Tax=Paraphotobacterium marinum TaxID=1755811 RepID=UPI0039ED746A
MFSWFTKAKNKHQIYLGIPFLILSILAMVILPLPPWLLDTLFTFNIVLSILVLLIATTTKRPIDFSIFPTILLIATLMRLTLNVASTRVVLLDGHSGPDAAGKVIEAFGSVVIGGNYVVGMVVFAILMIINFIVITKGGERISEVSARFTLDALPGKQMAIDADLNAGLIDQKEAKARRKDIASEADFYGSMDGASKFVRGDAIAGLLILFINLIGGICIGVFEYNLSMGDAFRTYALLTIGDGLVAQIPSLLLATSAAIIVTRVNDTDVDMSESMKKQLLASPSVLYTVAGIMLVIGIVPGMPFIAFFSFSAALFFAGWQIKRAQIRNSNTNLDALEEAAQAQKNQLLTWEEIPYTHSVELQLGFRLVPLVSHDSGAPLLQRIKGVRKTLSEYVGFLVPEVSIKDNLNLKPSEYTISIHGETVESGQIEANKLMAISSGETFGTIDGLVTKDPAYQLPATWINPDDKSKAINFGYSVVDDTTVISTHLSKVLKNHLAELFEHDDVEHLNQRLAQQAPKLAEKLSASIDINMELKIIRYLLTEQVPIKDIRTIATTMLESFETTKDPLLIASDIRCALKRTLIHLLNGNKKNIDVYTMAPELENLLLGALQQAQANNTPISLDSFPVEPNILKQFQELLPFIKNELKQKGLTPILLVIPQLRPLISRYARSFAKGLIVLSYNEIPDNNQINVVGNLG